MHTGGEYIAVDLKKAKRKDKFSSESVPKKYPHGKALKIDPKKVEDIMHFSNYLSKNGKDWIEKLVSGQQTACDRPQDEEEETHVDNMEEDDQFLEYTNVLGIRNVPGADNVITEVLAQALAESDNDD